MTPTASKRQLGASASAIWTQPAEVCHVFILPVLGRAHCCPARCESQPSESRRLLDASAGPWEPISGHSGEPARPRFSCAGLCAPPRAGSIHCTPRGRPKPTAELRGRSGLWHPYSLSVSILPAPDSKPGSTSVFTSVPNFPAYV